MRIKSTGPAGKFTSFGPQAAQAHDAITQNVTRVFQPHGGVVLQRFEFINVCIGGKRIRNLTYIRILW